MGMNLNMQMRKEGTKWRKRKCRKWDATTQRKWRLEEVRQISIGVRLENQGQVASQRDHNVGMRSWNLDDALVLNMK